MNPRWVPAAPVAALVLFAWSFISHMALHLEENFITGLPNEAALALKGTVKESGLYFFPNEPDMEKMAALSATQPYGLISVTVGKPFVFPLNLARQLGLYLVCSLIAAWLFTKALPNLRSVGEKVVFVALIGILGNVLIVGGFANWYNFPWGLVAVGVVDQGVGWGLAGWVFAKMIR